MLAEYAVILAQVPAYGLVHKDLGGERGTAASTATTRIIQGDLSADLEQRMRQSAWSMEGVKAAIGLRWMGVRGILKCCYKDSDTCLTGCLLTVLSKR